MGDFDGKLGPPAVLFDLFLGEGSPTNINYMKSVTLILASTGGPSKITRPIESLRWVGQEGLAFRLNPEAGCNQTNQNPRPIPSGRRAIFFLLFLVGGHLFLSKATTKHRVPILFPRPLRVLVT